MLLVNQVTNILCLVIVSEKLNGFSSSVRRGQVGHACSIDDLSVIFQHEPFYFHLAYVFAVVSTARELVCD